MAGAAALRWLLARRARAESSVRESPLLRSLPRARGGISRSVASRTSFLSMRDFFPASAEAVPQTNSVLVALRGDPNVYGHYELTAARLDALAAGLDSLVESRGVTVAFFPYQVGEEGDDHRVHREIQKRMAHPSVDGAARLDLQRRRIGQAVSRMPSCDRNEAARSRACRQFSQAMRLLPYDRKVADFGVQAGHTLRATGGEPRLTGRGRAESSIALLAVPLRSQAALPEGGGWPALTIDEIGGPFSIGPGDEHAQDTGGPSVWLNRPKGLDRVRGFKMAQSKPNFTVGVVIPTYNYAHGVSRAIESVLAQSRPARGDRHSE